MRALLLLCFSFPMFSQTVGPHFQWIDKIGSDKAFYAGLGTDAAGNTYVAAGRPSSANGLDVAVTKLDPSGNVLYTVSVGGSADDVASAMAVDVLGNVYVTGLTYSTDFPATKGAFLTAPPPTGPRGQKGSSFLFKLNSNGAVAFATYFAPSESNPKAISVDAGAVYITGSTFGGLPVTPGAYHEVCNCGIASNFFFSVPYSDGFVAKFDAGGAKLAYATYLNIATSVGMTVGTAIAAAPDGSAYVSSSSDIYRLSPTGSALLTRVAAKVNTQAMCLSPDGSLFIAGTASNGPGGFQATPGAAQPTSNAFPLLPYQPVNNPTAIVKMDATLQNTLAATWFGGPDFTRVLSLAIDTSGNLLVGGSTAPHGFPTSTPLVQGFGSPATGFAATLSPDLSNIIFSGYFGDSDYFRVQSVAPGPNGSLILGGSTAVTTNDSLPGDIWVNSVSGSPSPSLRIDSVVNAASQLDDPISTRETVVVRGSGFASDAQLLFNGIAADTVAATTTRLTAVLPLNLPDGAASMQVRSGGELSNSILVPVAAASPGLFSQDGTGRGQGYILNQDGTLNTPANPAHPGEKITLYATGVGPVNFNQGYAETTTPVVVNVEIFYSRGVAAAMRPVPGFPGDVYQLTVYVPSLAELAAANPDLKDFKYPPQVGLLLKIAGRSSQNGLAISVGQ